MVEGREHTRRHHGVVALITSCERARFFIQQKDEGYRPFPRGYSLFGGAIEVGEQPAEALARELREELGAAAERLLAAGATCVLEGRTLVTGVRVSLFEIVIEAAELEALAEVPVLEGLRGVVVEREVLRGMNLVWGLHELVGAYLER